MYFKNVESNSKPSGIEYSILPSGKAFVLIRNNISSEIMTDENGNQNTVFVYDEVQLITDKSLSEIENNKDDIIRMYSGGKPTIEERIDALEKAVSEIGGLL